MRRVALGRTVISKRSSSPNCRVIKAWSIVLQRPCVFVRSSSTRVARSDARKLHRFVERRADSALAFTRGKPGNFLNAAAWRSRKRAEDRVERISGEKDFPVEPGHASDLHVITGGPYARSERTRKPVRHSSLVTRTFVLCSHLRFLRDPSNPSLPLSLSLSSPRESSQRGDVANEEKRGNLERELGLTRGRLSDRR